MAIRPSPERERKARYRMLSRTPTRFPLPGLFAHPARDEDVRGVRAAIHIQKLATMVLDQRKDVRDGATRSNDSGLFKASDGLNPSDNALGERQFIPQECETNRAILAANLTS